MKEKKSKMVSFRLTKDQYFRLKMLIIVEDMSITKLIIEKLGLDK
jgi:hypothetical protein